MRRSTDLAKMREITEEEFTVSPAFIHATIQPSETVPKEE